MDIALLSHAELPTICVLCSGLYHFLKLSNVGFGHSLLCLEFDYYHILQTISAIELRVADGMILFNW